jgi:hypothetical protein
MTAAITDDSYNQQVTSIFDFLKSASPQQLAQVSQAVQQNPQSPEATALAMATNYQQQMRSGQAQAPQQTVYQKHIAQLLQSIQPPAQPAPMQSGIAAAGPNQYALQAAAAQDPMRNAGIGAAPENTPMQQAATGGLVALAHGGSVRGFANGMSVVPELGTPEYPEEEEEDPDPDFAKTDNELENATGAPDNLHLSSIDSTPKTRIPRQDGEDIHRPAPGSSAEKIAAKNTAFDSAVEHLMTAMGPSYSMSPELQEEYKGELKEANRDKWINALTQGVGGLLSAQTPYLSQAVGAGLLSGVSGYQQGSKEEADLRKQMMALRLASEKEHHADRRTATTTVYKTQADADKLAKQMLFNEWKARGGWQTLKDIYGAKAEGRFAPTEDQIMGWYNDEKARLLADPTIQHQRRTGQLSNDALEQLIHDNVNKRVTRLQGAGGQRQGPDRGALDSTILGRLTDEGIFSH